MEIMSLASAKETERMGGLFTFADGKVDQVLLNSETASAVGNMESQK